MRALLRQWQDRCALAAASQPNQRDFVFLLTKCAPSHAGPHADLQWRLVLDLGFGFCLFVIVLLVLEVIGLDVTCSRPRSRPVRWRLPHGRGRVNLTAVVANDVAGVSGAPETSPCALGEESEEISKALTAVLRIYNKD